MKTIPKHYKFAWLVAPIAHTIDELFGKDQECVIKVNLEISKAHTIYSKLKE